MFVDVIIIKINKVLLTFSSLLSYRSRIKFNSIILQTYISVLFSIHKTETGSAFTITKNNTHTPHVHMLQSLALNAIPSIENERKQL